MNTAIEALEGILKLKQELLTVYKNTVKDERILENVTEICGLEIESFKKAIKVLKDHDLAINFMND
jgi:hypothetical protein